MAERPRAVVAQRWRAARRARRWAAELCLASLAGLALGCSTAERRSESLPVWRAAPSDDVSPACADVGTQRVCWDAKGVPEPVARSTSGAPVSALGERCVGLGAARRCTDRARHAGTFRDVGGAQEQRAPRLPSDGEWTCADVWGVTSCFGGARAAGVPAAPDDAGWWCGARRGHPGEQVCLDLSPDFPDGDARAWRCSYVHEGAPRRTCTRDTTSPRFGVQPAAGASCEGLRVGHACWPELPRPECVGDRDCGAGRCVVGTCRSTP